MHGQGSILSCLLQTPLLDPQAEQHVAAHLELQLSEQFPKGPDLQTPESVRLSLQTGELFSLDFSDAYFHIPKKPELSKV